MLKSLNLEKGTITSDIFVFFEYLFFIVIGTVITSYYVLYLLILIRRICYRIYGENKYSLQNYMLYTSLLVIGCFTLKYFYNLVMPDHIVANASLILLGPLIAVYTVYVKDAHINRFVTQFLKKWSKTHKLDKLDIIKRK